MATLVTERPRPPIDKNKDRSGDFSYSSQRVFDVTGAASKTDAFAALVASGVDFDEPYDDDDPDAVVTGIATEHNPVAGMYTFTARYGDSQGDSFLAKPPQVRFQTYNYVDVADHDLDGVPYQNSSQTPFQDPLEVERTGIIITVRVPRPDYAFGDLFPYNNAVNSVDLLLPGGITVPAGMAKFSMPEMAFKDSSSSLGRWLDLKFDCREVGWKKNVIDAGAEGWGLDPSDPDMRTKGLFTTGAPASGPAGVIRLRGDGKPVDSTTFSRVADEYGNTYGLAFPPGSNPVESVISPHVDDGGLSTYPGSGSEGIVVLSFRRYKEMDLNDVL